MGWLSKSDIAAMGFVTVGHNVLISDKVSFHNCANITLGSNVRIDDFCVISAGEGGIVLGNYIHVAVYSSLMGAGKITLSNFCGLSSRVSIYSSNDDYSGQALTNPTVPAEYTKVKSADVFLEKHVIVGSGSIVLPGAYLEEGVAIGALSVVQKKCQAFNIYTGSPLKRIRERKNNILKLEKAIIESQGR